MLLSSQTAGLSFCCRYGCGDLGLHPTRRTSWKLVENPGCQPRLATSFQLVRLLVAAFTERQFSSVQFSSIYMYVCIAHPPMSLMRYSSTSVSIYKIKMF